MQYLLTPAAGKRLIAKSVAKYLFECPAAKAGTIVLIAGTTNGYVAEELLHMLDQSEGFSRKRFFRGITTLPCIQTTESGRLPDESQFPGDVIIKNGKWQKGSTIFDVVDQLQSGDIIVKGANCIDLIHKKAGILIGHPKGGTIVAALQATIGKRVTLILPIGLEKRVSDEIDSIAKVLNAPDSTGPRLMPVQGEIITELEAIEHLCGVAAKLIAAGGVCGAEGAVWINISGEKNSIESAKTLLNSVASEAPFVL